MNLEYEMMSCTMWLTIIIIQMNIFIELNKITEFSEFFICKYRQDKTSIYANAAYVLEVKYGWKTLYFLCNCFFFNIVFLNNFLSFPFVEIDAIDLWVIKR